MTKRRSFLVLVFALPAAVWSVHLSGAVSPSPVRIDSVPAKYALLDYSFAVSRKTGDAEVRLEYTYPGTYMNGDDSDRGPGVKTVLAPGLSYDAASNSVVYSDGSTRAVCAIARHGVRSREEERLHSTGACKVIARVSGHTSGAERSKTLDAFLEVAPK